MIHHSERSTRQCAFGQITSNFLVYNLQLPHKYDSHQFIMVEMAIIFKMVIMVEMVKMVEMVIMVVIAIVIRLSMLIMVTKVTMVERSSWLP